MKIKGSVEFENVEVIKNNLIRIIEQKGRCFNIKCEECIFSSSYATSGRCCNNTIFKMSSKNNKLKEKLIRAKEILAEIKEQENER